MSHWQNLTDKLRQILLTIHIHKHSISDNITQCPLHELGSPSLSTKSFSVAKFRTLSSRKLHMEWTVCVCIAGHAHTSWHSHVLGRNSHERARRNRNWSQQLSARSDLQMRMRARLACARIYELCTVTSRGHQGYELCTMTSRGHPCGVTNFVL